MIVNEMGKISALKDLESNRRVRKKMHVQIKKTITHSEEAYERSSQCAETETDGWTRGPSLVWETAVHSIRPAESLCRYWKELHPCLLNKTWGILRTSRCRGKL